MDLHYTSIPNTMHVWGLNILTEQQPTKEIHPNGINNEVKKDVTAALDPRTSH